MKVSRASARLAEAETRPTPEQYYHAGSERKSHRAVRRNGASSSDAPRRPPASLVAGIAASAVVLKKKSVECAVKQEGLSAPFSCTRRPRFCAEALRRRSTQASLCGNRSVTRSNEKERRLK